MQVQTLDPSNVEALTSRLANFIQILLEADLSPQESEKI